MNSPLEIRLDPASERQFHEGIKKFVGDGPRAFGQLLKVASRRVKSHVRAAGYSASSANSIGVGAGRYYGHVANGLRAEAGNIGWGGYIRIKHAPLKRFVARFHEFGTGGGVNDKGNRRGKSLPARGCLDHAYRTMDQNLLDRELSRAVDQMIK